MDWRRTQIASWTLKGAVEEEELWEGLSIVKHGKRGGEEMAHKGWRTFQSASALIHLAALTAYSFSSTAAAAGDAPLLRKVGACATTTIASIGTRFGAGKPSNSEGTSFTLKNMASGVADNYVADIAKSKVGDPVRTCVVSLPERVPSE